jgi:hypothetical protein
MVSKAAFLNIVEDF